MLNAMGMLEEERGRQVLELNCLQSKVSQVKLRETITIEPKNGSVLVMRCLL